MTATTIGYDENFLGEGLRVPLPTFSGELSPDVFNDGNEDWISFLHYSVATNTQTRQPIVVAL